MTCMKTCFCWIYLTHFQQNLPMPYLIFWYALQRKVQEKRANFMNGKMTKDNIPNSVQPTVFRNGAAINGKGDFVEAEFTDSNRHQINGFSPSHDEHHQVICESRESTCMTAQNMTLSKPLREQGGVGKDLIWGLYFFWSLNVCAQAFAKLLLYSLPVLEVHGWNFGDCALPFILFTSG